MLGGRFQPSTRFDVANDYLRILQVQVTHSQLEPQGQFWHFIVFSLDADKRLSGKRMSSRFLTPRLVQISYAAAIGIGKLPKLKLLKTPFSVPRRNERPASLRHAR
jgi:hypothetical protein